MEVLATTAELFLLDRWDHSSDLSPSAQCASHFAEFVRIGIRGRQVTFPSPVSSHKVHSKEAVIDIRESNPLKVPPFSFWLVSALAANARSAGRFGSEHATAMMMATTRMLPTHEALRESSEDFSGPNPHGKTVFDDAMLYDFGCQDWQRIFTRIPELVSEKGYNVDYYGQWRAEAVQAAVEADEERMQS